MRHNEYEIFRASVRRDEFGFTNYEARRQGIERWGFAIPNAMAIAAIVSLSPIVELGAGTGYWAKLLAEAGADVRAFDVNVPSVESENPYPFQHSKLHFNVEQGCEDILPDSTALTLLLVWPCYSSSFAADALKLFKGEYLAFVGESRGGCVADDDFFDALADHWEEVRHVSIPQWSGIHDSLLIYRRT